MKDIPEADLLRAELQETKRDLAMSDAARLELRAALDDVRERLTMASEILATVIHKSGTAGVTLTDTDRHGAWEACWLRMQMDVLEPEEGQSGPSVRVSLLPPDAEERAANAATLKAETDKPKLELLDS